MTSIWATIITVGIFTYLTRLSFILLLEYWQTPPIFQRALRFVPISVFAAIILPDLVFPNNSPNIIVFAPRFFSGIIAIIVAWKTNNVAWTIIVGMGTLLLIKSYV
ncbi:MAG: AzlD domain-containing protein [Anaerolineae bacterium]|nr:AzlD domain-containing protein [Anaerolineae bacterium]